MTDPTLTVEVTDKAKERLRAALARETRARFVRIDVGRGWGGYSYHLSLDETADKGDLTTEVDGLSFVADGRWHFALSGLRIDVQDYWGRETLVVLNAGLSSSC